MTVFYRHNILAPETATEKIRRSKFTENGVF